MHHGQNRGKQKKRKLSHKRILNETMGKCINSAEIGEISKFCGNWGICNMLHWLRGMDASDRGRGRYRGIHKLYTSTIPYPQESTLAPNNQKLSRHCHQGQDV